MEKETFYLDKWYLDFTGKNGEAIIFYAAKLKWMQWQVSYVDYIIYYPASGVKQKSRFRNVLMPELKNETITWNDLTFDISGVWQSNFPPINARLFSTEEGYLDWKCHQPLSSVSLKYNEQSFEGTGYAEQLILTLPPWKIPMNELRWGRFGSEENQIVWIELKEKIGKQWLWYNNEKIENCVIKDHQILLPDKNIELKLDKAVILEFEKKIFSVIKKVVRYIPGFNKIVPFKFLMADECKWLSNGKLLKNNSVISKGKAIHEFVNFK